MIPFNWMKEVAIGMIAVPTGFAANKAVVPAL